MKTFHLHIVTPSETVFDGEIESLQAPGMDGYFGVLADHAPLIAALGKGNLTLHKKDRTILTWQLDGGFLEVSDNHAILLAESIIGEIPGGA